MDANTLKANKVLITMDGTIKDLGDATGAGGHRQYNIGFEKAIKYLDRLPLFDLFSNLVGRTQLFTKKNTSLGSIITTRPGRLFLENGDSKLYPVKGAQTPFVTTFTTTINYSKKIELMLSPEEIYFGKLITEGIVMDVLALTRLQYQRYTTKLVWATAETVTQLCKYVETASKIKTISIKKEAKGDPVIGEKSARKWLWGTLYVNYTKLIKKWTNYGFGIKKLILLISPDLWAPITQALYNFTESTRQSFKSNESDMTAQFANMKIYTYGKLGEKVPKGKPSEVPGAIDADDEYDMSKVNAIIMPAAVFNLHIAEIVDRMVYTPQQFFSWYNKWYFPRPTDSPGTGFVKGTGINFKPYAEYVQAFNFKFVDPA